MEQRPLRLGDVVDDYCPRERRVTNHAIVAIVEDVIRQTRCTACDTEHSYKGAREPRLRRKPGTEGLYEQVLADVSGGAPAAPASAAQTAITGAPGTDTPADDARAAEGETPVEEPATAAWISHRQLIRATLPKTENDQPPPRPIPEFTMHQRQTRGSRAFRFSGQGSGNGNPNGNANGNVNGNTGGRPGHGFGGPPGANRHGGKHSGRRHRGGKRPR
jgi:hypothetical protein